MYKSQMSNGMTILLTKQDGSVLGVGISDGYTHEYPGIFNILEET